VLVGAHSSTDVSQSLVVCLLPVVFSEVIANMLSELLTPLEGMGSVCVDCHSMCSYADADGAAVSCALCICALAAVGCVSCLESPAACVYSTLLLWLLGLVAAVQQCVCV
jgi:hypothetical protein